MTNVLVPIAICCILPICVVWIIFHAATNGDNKRAEVLIKAIESNNGIDADRLADALAKHDDLKNDEITEKLEK